MLLQIELLRLCNNLYVYCITFLRSGQQRFFLQFARTDIGQVLGDGAFPLVTASRTYESTH